MLKKRVSQILAGVFIVIVGVGLFGLSACYPQEETIQFSYAFASDRSGAGDIFALDRAGQIVNLTNHPGADWDPAWSFDGRTLAFTSQRSGDSDIWLLTLPTPGEETSAPRNLTNNPAWEYSPSWSPSGQSVVFVSERDGDAEIFVQHLEGDTAIQLTFNNEMDRLPVWSPDGKYIAFAAVRNGVEKIYRVRPDGTDEQIVTPGPLKGTSPAWSPDSERLAFIGWDEEDMPGIYVIGPDADDLQMLYPQGDSDRNGDWLGSLHWAADGQWLTFTSWQAGNHELYALSAEGGQPTRLTINEGWDDFLAINPKAVFTPPPPEQVVQAAPALKLPPNPDFATGANLADLGLAYLVNDMGLDWAKGYVNWGTVEPEQGDLQWVDPDNIVKAYGDQQLKILLRVHGVPAWARPADTALSHPPNDMADFAAFMTALVERYKGQVAAYEIWNEPNLDYEWGYQPPDPAVYAEMLKTAYTVIKKTDPEALVISGGLATTGEGSETAYGDLKFLQGMYDAGAKGYFDALGSHPYAYGRAPDETDPWGLSLARVVDQHEIMQQNGDGDTPIWITEAGWVLQNSWDLDEHETIGVTPEQQAEYLTRAYAKTRQEWPFVRALFLFNLDFSTVPWYPAAEPMRWYAILNPDRTPRPAYTDLRQMMRER